MDVTPATIRVTIDELVLDRVGPRDPLVANAVRRALVAAMPQPVASPDTTGRAADAVTRTIAERAG
jgi:hypothetical protein